MHHHATFPALLCGLLLLPTQADAQAITLDPSFGTNGTAPIPVVGFDEQIGAKRILELADGSKLAAGILFDFDNGHQWGVTRMTGDGTIDGSFGTGGMARIDFAPQDGELFAMAERPDGRIVIAGHSSISMGFGNPTEYFGRVAQLLPNGQLDPAFGDEGIATVRYQDWQTEVADMVLQPNGKVVVVGQVRQSGVQFPFVGRLNADGTMDETFGIFSTDGLFTLYVGGTFPRGRAVTLLPDGRIVVVATHSDEIGAGEMLNLVRLLPNGEMDPTFGNNGYVHLLDHRESSNTIQPWVLADGRIRLFYTSNAAPFSPGPPVTLGLLADGSIDSGHGEDGVLTMSFPELNGYVAPTAMKAMMDSAGRTTLVGSAGHLMTKSSHACMARFLPDGTSDLSFSTNGVMMLPQFRECVDAALQPDGKLVVGMRGTTPTGGDGMAVVRFHPVSTGVDEHVPLRTLAAWPVPTHDHLYLRLPVGNGVWTVTVHAADGRTVALPMDLPRDGTMRLTVSGLTAGAYVVHAVRDGRQYQARFVVEAP